MATLFLLNRQVSIQGRTSAVDALGQPIETWTEVAKVWANIRHPSGIETITGGADTSIVKASIKIRRRMGVTPAMRVVYGQAIYSIDAVLHDEVDRMYTTLVCGLIQ